MGREDRALRYVGVDPGDTTGIAFFDPLTSTFCSVEVHATEALRYLTDIVTGSSVVACERFTIGTGTARKSRSSHATNVIGALRELCQDRDVRFILRSASDAKSLATNELLQRAGWHHRGKRHANDAARHTLLNVAQLDPEEFAKIVEHA
jgi:hypothetical protein